MAPDGSAGNGKVLTHRRDVIPALDLARKWRQLTNVTTERDDPVRVRDIFYCHCAWPVSRNVDPFAAKRRHDRRRGPVIRVGAGGDALVVQATLSSHAIKIGCREDALGSVVGTEEKYGRRQSLVTYLMTNE